MNVEKSFYFKCRKIRFILNVEKSFYFENKGYMKVKKKVKHWNSYYMVLKVRKTSKSLG